MIQIAICEDDQILLEQLGEQVRGSLDRHSVRYNLKLFLNGGALLSCSAFDILLLDIAMKPIDGLELARRLRLRGDKSRLIFITAYRKYAIEAYDVQAFHYLLKPVDSAKLEELLLKLCSSLQKERRHAIAVRQGTSVRRIPLEQVLYLEFLMMEILQHKLHVLKQDFTNQDAIYLMYIILFIYGAVDMMMGLFAGIRGLTPEVAIQLAWPCSLIALGGVGLYVYCVVMLEDRIIRYAAERQYQTMDLHLEASKEQYLQLEHFQHDIKNHVLCLKKLLGNGKEREALCYLEQMDGRIEQEKFKVQTGSVYVDSILTPKYDKAMRLGIDIDISMTVPVEEEIAPIDLCCLIGNALDNAIEACQRRSGENDGAGWIRMKSHLCKGYWVFEISNSIHVVPAVYKGWFLSSKRRQAYGVGLQNIKAVVERYKGVMEVEKGEHFTLSVMIPGTSLH